MKYFIQLFFRLSSLAPVLLALPQDDVISEKTSVKDSSKIPDSGPRSPHLRNKSLDNYISVDGDGITVNKNNDNHNYNGNNYNSDNYNSNNYNKNSNNDIKEYEKYGNHYENFGESFARRNNIPLGASEDRKAILTELSDRLTAFENKIESGFNDSLYLFNNVSRKHYLWNEINNNNNHSSDNNDNNNNNSSNNNDNNNDNNMNSNDNNNNNNSNNNNNNNNKNNKNNNTDENKNNHFLATEANFENIILSLENSKNENENGNGNENKNGHENGNDNRNEMIKNEIQNIKKQINEKRYKKEKRIWNQRIVPPEFYGNFDKYEKYDPINYTRRGVFAYDDTTLNDEPR